MFARWNKSKYRYFQDPSQWGSRVTNEGAMSQSTRPMIGQTYPSKVWVAGQVFVVAESGGHCQVAHEQRINLLAADLMGETSKLLLERYQG